MATLPVARSAEFVSVNLPSVLFRLCSQDSDSQGKLFIALILNVLLLGINITQTYIYYIHSKK